MNRKQIMALTLAGLMSMGIIAASAQDAPAGKQRKEIIIREKEGKGEKMTIVVDGDNITINGKPIAEYDGDNIIIRKKNLEEMTRPYVYAMPRSPKPPRPPMPPMPPMAPESFSFSFDENMFAENAGKPRAQLGIISEKDDKGAKLTEVLSESAAAKAGLKEGDIITAIDGKKIDGPESLQEQIRAKKPEQETSVTYLRDKKSKTVKVKLGTVKSTTPKVYEFNAPMMERELSRQFREMDRAYGQLEKQYKMREAAPFKWEMERGASASKPKLGVRIEDMEEGKGVKVIDVEPGSPAEKAGFKKDDILTHIDDKKITNTDQAREQIKAGKDKSSFSMSVERNGKPYNMDVKIPRDLKKADL